MQQQPCVPSDHGVVIRLLFKRKETLSDEGWSLDKTIVDQAPVFVSALCRTFPTNAW